MSLILIEYFPSIALLENYIELKNYKNKIWEVKYDRSLNIWEMFLTEAGKFWLCHMRAHRIRKRCFPKAKLNRRMEILLKTKNVILIILYGVWKLDNCLTDEQKTCGNVYVLQQKDADNTIKKRAILIENGNKMTLIIRIKKRQLTFLEGIMKELGKLNTYRSYRR